MRRAFEIVDPVFNIVIDTIKVTDLKEATHYAGQNYPGTVARDPKHPLGTVVARDRHNDK